MGATLSEKGRTELAELLESFLANFTHEVPPPWVGILSDCIGSFLKKPGVLQEDFCANATDVHER